MVAEQKHVLISFNDNPGINHQTDYQVALDLQKNLHSRGMNAEVRGYNQTILNPTVHQWLIFIPSQDMVKSGPINEAIDSALVKVVEREMEGVLAITTSTINLPPKWASKWASIRTYDSTSQSSEDIWRAMQHAKIPYEKAVARQSRQLVGAYATRRAPQRVLAITIILVIVLILGGVGTFAYMSHKAQSEALIAKQQTATVTAKAHAMAKAKANATGTAVAQLTPKVTPTLSPNELQKRQKEFDNLAQKTPTIDGFLAVNQWSTATTDTQTCTFDNAGQYVTGIKKTPNHYFPCMAQQTSYTNFALQVNMNIQGDAGGIIFRSDDGPTNYYRLSINQTDKVVDTFSLYLCNADCVDNATNQGTKIVSETHTVDRTKPITFIIQGQNIDLFIDGKYLTRFSEPTSNIAPTKGQIGFYGASLGQDTIVTWSDLKVWSLDKTAK